MDYSLTEGVTYRRREVAWRTRSRVNTPPPPSRTPQSGCAHDTGPAEPLARSARADRPISGLGASLGSRGLPDVSAEGRSPLQGVLYTSCSICSQHPIDESTYCEQRRVPTQANHMRRGGNHCTEDVISIGFVVTPLPHCLRKRASRPALRIVRTKT